MPAVDPGSKILVSGANGFIAVWIVRVLLERGYSVRGTVRSESKAGYLRKMFSSYGDKHEVVVVEDIGKEGAFDDAVNGVSAILHTASPCAINPDEDITIPAVKGTTSILQSALKYGSNVRRVVVTGSCSSVITPGISKPNGYTEEDWNEVSVQEVNEKGRQANPMHVYRASKILAEKSVWGFVEKNKSSLKWDATVITPPYVLGPPIQELSSPEQLNASISEYYKAVMKTDVDVDFLTKTRLSWVDVRDISLAHVLALEKEAAGDQRILVSAGSFLWQDWVLCANALNPPIYENLSKGNTDYNPETSEPVCQYNSAKADKILGIKYKPMEETTKDLLEEFKRRGW